MCTHTQKHTLTYLVLPASNQPRKGVFPLPEETRVLPKQTVEQTSLFPLPSESVGQPPQIQGNRIRPEGVNQPQVWAHATPTTQTPYQLLGPLNTPVHPTKKKRRRSGGRRPLYSKQNHNMLHVGENRPPEVKNFSLLDNDGPGFEHSFIGLKSPLRSGHGRAPPLLECRPLRT